MSNCNVIEWIMKSQSMKGRRKLISEDGEREKKEEEAKADRRWKASWHLSESGQSTRGRSANHEWMTAVIKND